jgi:hypothetical protein
MNYLTPSGESAVLWNTAKASALFTWLKNNTGPARPAAHSTSAKGGKASKVSRASVSVDVYNGTQISGLSAATGSQLSALGFHVTRSGLDWSSDTVTRTLIRYPPGQAAAARLLAAALPGAQLRETAGLPRIQLVLGASAHAVAGKAASTGPSAPVQQRTAAQDACR